MREVAILTGPSTHLDHLGVLADYLGIPLIVTDLKTYELATLYYPMWNTHYVPMEDLNGAFLSEQFDLIFESGKSFAIELDAILETIYRKPMRYVFVPHGHSDKGHSLKQHLAQDIHLVYGNHMIDLMNQNGSLSKVSYIILTGNYRYSFYEKNKQFYSNIIKNQLNLDSRKKVILYAPTWIDGENPSCFFEVVEILAASLLNYNFLIKIHPFLEQKFPVEILLLKQNCNAIWVDDLPIIYPLLEQVDLFIGDYSSIGYDFLMFNRPLYFLKGSPPASCLLHEAGMELPTDEDIEAFIGRTLEENRRTYEEKRKAIKSYVFGEVVDPNLLKYHLKKACGGQKKSFK